jgi:hypothetical protein
LIKMREKEVVWNFYNGLLGTASQRELTLDLHAFHRPPIDLSELEEDITEEEVRSATNVLPSDKAPGQMVLRVIFYKIAWHLIKDDFMAAIYALMKRDVSRLHLLNSAYIVLLPKVPNAIVSHPDLRDKVICVLYMRQRKTSHITTKYIEIKVTNIIII